MLSPAWTKGLHGGTDGQLWARCGFSSATMQRDLREGEREGGDGNYQRNCLSKSICSVDQRRDGTFPKIVM